MAAALTVLALAGSGSAFLAGRVATPEGKAASGGRAAPAVYNEAIKGGQASAREFIKASGVPGLSVAVGVQGRVVWSEGFGYADIEQRVPVTPRTRFRLGSVSKVLTAAAVARLHQAGKLDLDAPIQKYVPTFPDKGAPITTRQLAGHLAGIRHYQPKDFSNGRNIDFEHYDKVLDSLKIFQDDPLVAPPGTRYHYSTFGYTLISQVVEGASGLGFLEYMDRELFQALGMRQTCADRTEAIIPDRTRFYQRGPGGKQSNAAYVDSSYKWAGGGLLSSAEDLVLFGSTHLRPGFFERETLDLLFTPQRTADGKETGVGVGWRIGSDSMKRRVIHHAGSISGGRSVIVIFPDTGVVIALLSNLGETPPAVEQTALALAEPFVEVAEARERKGARLDLAGVYDYVVESPAQSKAGKIELVRAKGGYEGWMSTPGPLSEFARRTGAPVSERLKIAAVTVNGDGARLTLASPSGLFPLRVRSVGGELSGEVACPLGPKVLEMKMKLKKRAGGLPKAS